MSLVMDYNKKRIDKEDSSCFVIMPFNEKRDIVYQRAIRPAVENTGLKCIRADERLSSTPILFDIYEAILSAKVLIADISEPNANVYYELGIGHALKQRVILLCEKGAHLPFDIGGIRHITYEWSMGGEEVLQKALEGSLIGEVEKNIPTAKEETFGNIGVYGANSEKFQQIFQQIIYGSVNTAISGEQGSNIILSIKERDNDSLIEYLVSSGIPKTDAKEVAEIMATEEPTNIDEPFGDKTKDWITSNLKKAVQGTWNIGISVATRVLSEAALRYYGMK